MTSPKRVVDFPRERDTFRNKIMEIVVYFDEKSYNNNGKTLEIVEDFAYEAKFLHFFIVHQCSSFFSFSIFFIFSVFFFFFPFFRFFSFFSCFQFFVSPVFPFLQFVSFFFIFVMFFIFSFFSFFFIFLPFS